MLPGSDLIDRLPHTPPARLVTSAVMDPQGDACIGFRATGGADPLANEAGFLPSSLLIELMAQTAGLILPGESSGAWVAGLRNMRLHDGARGGEPVEVRARLERRMGSLFLFECRASSSGRLLATGSITLRAF